MKLLLKACGCCELSTGSVIAAWIDIVIYFITTVFGSVMIIFHEHIFSSSDANTVGYFFLMIGIVTVAAICFVTAICLFVGVVNRNRYLMIPYLFSQLIVLIVCVVSQIVSMFISQRSSFISTMLMFMCYFAFRLYQWLWVYSLYVEVRTDDERAGNNIGLARKEQTTKVDDLPPYNTFA